MAIQQDCKKLGTNTGVKEQSSSLEAVLRVFPAVFTVYLFYLLHHALYQPVVDSLLDQDD